MVFHKTHGMNQPLFSMRTLYVSRTPADSSVYPTISAALDAIPMDLNEPACIYLAPGIYHEKITINKPYLTILGTGKSNKDVVLTYDLFCHHVYVIDEWADDSYSGDVIQIVQYTCTCNRTALACKLFGNADRLFDP